MSTIAAIATAYAQNLSGGIGIIRISGEKSLDILKAVFVPKNNKNTYNFKPRYMHFGNFLDKDNNILDEGLAVYMKAPHSYTAEDTVELHCHGNPNLLNALLEACFFHGAELAKAGEFTKRAYLNGRLDLSQAEAVAEVISAPSIESSRMARAKLSGLLGEKIRSLRASLEDVMQNLLYELDFSEEELPDITPFIEKVENIHTEIKSLIFAYERAEPWKDGALIVLAGKANAGKSSLFNALLGRYRAIVTEKAGTTRDYIEEYLKINNLPIRLIDTAGIRKEEETSDTIEIEGINNAFKLFKEAQIILYLIDVNSDFVKDKENIALLHTLNPNANVLLIWNKCDIIPFNIQNKAFDKEIYPISAKEGKGIDFLAQVIYNILSSQSQGLDTLSPNLRQVRLLAKSSEELSLFKENSKLMPPDALALHISEAVNILSEITGEIITEDIVNSIFETFCVGK